MRNTLDNAKKEGLEEGLIKGERNKTIEIAKNLLEMKMPFETITKATGLSLEEVKNL